MSHILRDSHCCAYCGQLADTRDHVLPVSYRANRNRKHNGKHYGSGTVPACRRCNSWLNDICPDDLSARAEELAEMLMRKNGKLLNQPAWSDEEIEELGPTMQQYIRGRIAIKLQLHSDLSHATSVARSGLRTASDYWEIVS